MVKEISIILVGNWNIKIFSPGWIMNELLGLQNHEELEIGFDNYLQPIYKYKNIHFTPTERAFEIRFDVISDTTIRIANNSAKKLITTLPFTPNLVVGFNYRLAAENCDFSQIALPGYTNLYDINEIKLNKQENNYLLSVILNCNPEKIVTYNFHYSNLNYIKDNTIHEHLDYIKDNVK